MNLPILSVLLLAAALARVAGDGGAARVLALGALATRAAARGALAAGADLLASSGASFAGHCCLRLVSEFALSLVV